MFNTNFVKLAFDIMLNKCYRIIWLVLNFAVDIYKACFLIRLRMAELMLWSPKLNQIRQQQEIAFLKDLKEQLSKIPKHLSLIIGNEYKGFSEEILRRILSYAILMEIDYISLYDTRNFHPSSIEHSIIRKKDNIKVYTEIDMRLLAKKNTICCGDGCLPLYTKKGISNNCTQSNGELHQLKNQTIKMYNIQHTDGRHLLAHICRKIFTKRNDIKVQKIFLKRVNISEYISEQLKHNLSQLIEPELSIIFSNGLCTYGYLPWHIRLTEFYCCKSGRQFDVQTFAQILHRYARCNQNGGK